MLIVGWTSGVWIISAKTVQVRQVFFFFFALTDFSSFFAFLPQYQRSNSCKKWQRKKVTLSLTIADVMLFFF